MSKKQRVYKNTYVPQSPNNGQKKPSKLAYIITAILIFFWFVGSCLGTIAFIENKVDKSQSNVISAGAATPPNYETNFDNRTFVFTSNVLTGLTFNMGSSLGYTSNPLLTTFDWSFSMVNNVVRMSFMDSLNRPFDIELTETLAEQYIAKGSPDRPFFIRRSNVVLPENGIPYSIQYCFYPDSTNNQNSVLALRFSFVDENGNNLAEKLDVYILWLTPYGVVYNLWSPYLNSAIAVGSFNVQPDTREIISNVRLYDYYKRYNEGYNAGFDEGYNAGYAQAVLDADNLSYDTLFSGATSIFTITWESGLSSVFNLSASRGGVYDDPEVLARSNPSFDTDTVASAIVRVDPRFSFSLYKYRLYAYEPLPDVVFEFYDDMNTDVVYTATVADEPNSAGFYPLVFDGGLEVYARCSYFVITTDLDQSFRKIAITSDIGQYDLSYDQGYTDGYKTGKIEGYYRGYEAGREIGDREGFNRGYSSGLSVGNIQGYERGYDNGYADAIDGFDGKDYSFVGLISAVVDVPIKTLTGLLDFNILGVNMSSFFFSLFSVCVVLFVVKLLI